MSFDNIRKRLKKAAAAAAESKSPTNHVDKAKGISWDARHDSLYDYDGNTVPGTAYLYSKPIPDAPYLDFDLIRDYLNIRNRWQKSYTSIAGDPGFFYFRIFFDFEYSALLSDAHNIISAAYFFQSNHQRLDHIRTTTDYLLPNKHLAALIKFLNLLKYISYDTPWCFKSISGLSNILNVDMSAPGEATDRILRITCNPETVDFRLTLLADLYRFIVYDYKFQRILLPENLRKFNMAIVFFEEPVKWHHTPISDERIGNQVLNAVSNLGSMVNLTSVENVNSLINKYKSPGWKTINDDLTVRVVQLHDCEFDVKSMTSGWDSGDNTNPFQTSYTFNINVNRAYTTTISEWFKVQVDQAMTNYYGVENNEEIKQREEVGKKVREYRWRSQLGYKVNSESSQNSPGGSKLKSLLSGLVTAVKNKAIDMGIDVLENLVNWDETGGGEEVRLKLIREKTVYGATSNASFGKGISSALDNGINGFLDKQINNHITLGNIYTDSTNKAGWYIFQNAMNYNGNTLVGALKATSTLIADNIGKKHGGKVSKYLMALTLGGLSGVASTMMSDFININDPTKLYVSPDSPPKADRYEGELANPIPDALGRYPLSTGYDYNNVSESILLSRTRVPTIIALSDNAAKIDKAYLGKENYINKQFSNFGVDKQQSNNTLTFDDQGLTTSSTHHKKNSGSIQTLSGNRVSTIDGMSTDFIGDGKYDNSTGKYSGNISVDKPQTTDTIAFDDQGLTTSSTHHKKNSGSIQTLSGNRVSTIDGIDNTDFIGDGSRNKSTGKYSGNITVNKPQSNDTLEFDDQGLTSTSTHRKSETSGIQQLSGNRVSTIDGINNTDFIGSGSRNKTTGKYSGDISVNKPQSLETVESDQQGLMPTSTRAGKTQGTIQLLSGNRLSTADIVDSTDYLDVDKPQHLDTAEVNSRGLVSSAAMHDNIPGHSSSRMSAWDAYNNVDFLDVDAPQRLDTAATNEIGQISSATQQNSTPGHSSSRVPAWDAYDKLDFLGVEPHQQLDTASTNDIGLISSATKQDGQPGHSTTRVGTFDAIDKVNYLGVDEPKYPGDTPLTLKNSQTAKIKTATNKANNLAKKN